MPISIQFPQGLENAADDSSQDDNSSFSGPGPQGAQGSQGEQGITGPQGLNGDLQGTVLAGLYTMAALDNIPAFSVVTTRGRLANSNDLSQIGKVAGVSIQGAQIGNQVTVCFFGSVSNSSWNWDVSKRVFLNGTIVATTAPETGWVQPVGSTVDSTTIFIQIGESILL